MARAQPEYDPDHRNSGFCWIALGGMDAADAEKQVTVICAWTRNVPV
jgi:hypothetical protein